MTASKHVTLICDHPGCTTVFESPEWRVRPARMEAARWGWTHKSAESARDLCPDHSK